MNRKWEITKVIWTKIHPTLTNLNPYCLWSLTLSEHWKSDELFFSILFSFPFFWFNGITPNARKQARERQRESGMCVCVWDGWGPIGWEEQCVTKNEKVRNQWVHYIFICPYSCKSKQLAEIAAMTTATTKSPFARILFLDLFLKISFETLPTKEEENKN